MQKVSDAPLKKCPNCGKSSLKRLMSAPVFRLKGSGWYETDFKSDQDNKRNLADKPEPEAKDEKSDAKKDDKADAKPEPKKEEKKSEAPAANVKKPAAAKAGSSRATAPRAGGKPKSKAKARAKRR